MGGQSLNASFVCAKAGDESSNSAAANLYIISSQKYDCAQPQQPPKGLVPKERAFDGSLTALRPMSALRQWTEPLARQGSAAGGMGLPIMDESIERLT